MKKAIFILILPLLALPVFSQLAEKVGVGVRLQLDSARGYKIPHVVEVIPNSPSKNAGVLAGDFILKVNGVSTRDVELAKIVEMIVGEEGTEVTLQVERGAVQRNFTMTRQKYKFANSFYESDKPEDPFCKALTTLLNDAAYDFENTMDSTRYKDEEGAFGRRYYESKVSVPGAQRVAMASSFGITCQVEFPSLASEDEVNTAGEKLVGQISACFPEYYYKPVVLKSGSNKVQIGRQFSNGFESAIIELYSVRSESDGRYTLTMRINGGVMTRYYSISTPAQDNSFATPLRAIYDDVLNNYSSVKGTKHENPSAGPFSMSSWWYEVSPLPAGAHDCSISEGGLSSSGCRCRFYLGESHDEAVEAFNKLHDVIRDALGSDFVYSYEKPDLDMAIPGEVEGVVIFGIKKEWSYESLPLAALVVYKETETQYAVNLLFHKFGF